MHGVIIEQGPSDYQIFQRDGNGQARVSVSGRCERLGTERDRCAYVRVCREETGVPVLWWQPARMQGDRFTIELTLPTGGPYRLETTMVHADSPAIERSFRGDTRFHLYVGDLYAIAGQSNSAGYGRDPVPDAPAAGVHLFRNSGKWDIATHPLNDSTDTAFPVNTEYGNPGHSPWLAFAKEVYRVTGIPIGLIQSSLGGSPLSDWSPEGGKLYASLLERIERCGGAISGLLWYQGCSDTSAALAPTYLERFSDMAAALRSRWPGLPVFTVQLNRHTDSSTPENDRGWGQVKEAQRQAAMLLKRVFLVPSGDCATSDTIHNSASGNIRLGLRTANQALNYHYGYRTNCLAPNIIKALRTGQTGVSLQFENVYERLYFFDRDPLTIPFELADENGVHRIIGVRLLRERVELTTERPLGTDVRAGMAYQKNPADVVPIDAATYMPVLSFYDVPIE